MHLFVDISSHGLGHLAITAPVLNALGAAVPGLTLTVRSLIPAEKLRQRIRPPFTTVAAASDFGFLMHDALSVDLPASAAAYRQAHAAWASRVEAEARFLKGLGVDAVFANVAYLPLAGAASAGIPAAAMCSLNWADLFAHYFGDEDWAAPIHADMLAAYRSARAFLRCTPGMPMPTLGNVRPVAPVAALGRRHELGLPAGERAVLVALGGIAHRLPLENWPRGRGIRWLVPREWRCSHPDALVAEDFGLAFTDLLCSVDAVLTKPGYGTFTEAACNGTPVLYQRREDWPEQECLIDWLQRQGNCRELPAAALASGEVAGDLAALLAEPPRPAVVPSGAGEAAGLLLAALTAA